MSCSRVQVKKEEPEDCKVDIKVEHKASSCHHCSSSSYPTNDNKPVIIKHEIKKENYDSDCDCNDCRVAQGKVIKTTTNDADLWKMPNQTDKQHEGDCGRNEQVQDGRQVSGQVIRLMNTDQASGQGAYDQSVDLTDRPTGEDASRSSTLDWMPSIFSDDGEDEESDDADETEIDEELTQDDRDDDDADFNVNDGEEENDIDHDHDETQDNADDNNLQEEINDKVSSDNIQTSISLKRKHKSVSRVPKSPAQKHKCSTNGCGKAFKLAADLKRHTRVHTGVRQFVCIKCEKKFSRKYQLQTHESNVHLKIKQWRCRWRRCKHRSGYLQGMVKHVKAVHLEKSDDKTRDPMEFITKCDKVESSAQEDSSEVEESSTEEEEDDGSKRKSRFMTVYLNCLDCSKTFETKGQLMRHQLKAHRIQQFRCLVKDCLASFEKINPFTRHRAVKHGSSLPCRECDQQLKTYQELVQHFRMKHKKGRFVCTDHSGCTVESDNIWDMVVHVRAHKTTKHRCRVCKKRFRDRNDLQAHERQHSGDRPFGCAQCDKRYTTNSELNKHIRAKHQSRKLYGCKWQNCQHETGYLNGMHKHVRTHFVNAGNDEKRATRDFIEKRE